MKQRNFLLFFIAACLIALTIVNIAPVQGSGGSPNGGICVIFHATANTPGRYCGPTADTFTVGSNGTVEICNLTIGTYTFCTDAFEVGYQEIQNDQIYNVYVSAEAQCPCP